MLKSDELKAGREEQRLALIALNDLADGENRDLTEDEAKAFAAGEDAIKAFDARISRNLTAEKLIREAPAFAEPDTTQSRVQVAELPMFDQLGEQLVAIAREAMGGETDPRLANVRAAATGAGAATPQDGGTLIQTAFSDQLLQGPRTDSVLYPRTRRVPIPPGFDGIELPIIDESSRVDGSRWGGVRLYRANEGDAVTATKPKFAENFLKLEWLYGLAYATDRLLQAASTMEAIFREAFQDEYRYKLDSEIYRGTGAGEMTGVMNADSLVTVSKESGQASATIVSQNLIKMWERMPSGMKATSIWVHNSDCFNQLIQMHISIGTGGQLVYMPPGGISGAPFGNIFGAPVIEIEQASTLGTIGDIALLNLREYVVIEQGGVAFDSSMHVRFIQHEMTFRWALANNGRPIWKQSQTPAKGTKEKGPLIVLQAR